MPWTIFVVVSVYSEIKGWFKKSVEKSWGVYLLGSVLILLVILSIARGKAPNYFLITVSPISIISAKWITFYFTKNQDKTSNLSLIQFIFTGIFGIGFIGILTYLAFIQLWLFILICVLFAGTFYVLIKKKIFNLRNTILISVIVAGSLNLFLNAKVFPKLFSYQGARQVLEIYEQQRSANSQLYNFELEEYELFFYAKYSVKQIKNWEELNKSMHQSNTWIYTNKIKYDDILEMKYEIDSVYQINQRGMNKISLQFLNPKTRNESLEKYFLIKTK